MRIMTRRSLLMSSAIGIVVGRITAAGGAETFEVTHTDVEWRKLLTPNQYSVLRQSATERPFTSPLLDEQRKGTFGCAGCDLGLFSSDTKFESGTGWPSFWAPLDRAVGTERDTAFGMIRTSVHCARCDGILAMCSTMAPSRPACGIA
jgi:peptide-methionine (R)-S-oxide reductase